MTYKAPTLKPGDLVVLKKRPNKVGWVYSLSLHDIWVGEGEYRPPGMMVRVAWSHHQGGFLGSYLKSEWTAANLLYVERLPSSYNLYSVSYTGEILDEFEQTQQEAQCNS